MYFVLKSDQSLASSHAYFSNDPVGFESTAWISGSEFLIPPPRLSLVPDEDSAQTFTDLLLTMFNLFVVSQRLVRLFKQMGLQNLRYYPVDIQDQDGKDIITGYHAVQVIGTCECLDQANADLMFSDYDQSILSVETFSIIEDNIKPFEGFEEKPLIFRLKEFPYIVLAHESIKIECERIGITGMNFIPPEKYL